MNIYQLKVFLEKHITETSQSIKDRVTEIKSIEDGSMKEIIKGIKKGLEEERVFSEGWIAALRFIYKNL